MASIRKVKKQAERQKLRDLAKHRRNVEKKKIKERDEKLKKIRKDVREALGFDKLKIKRKCITENPCREIPLPKMYTEILRTI